MWTLIRPFLPWIAGAAAVALAAWYILDMRGDIATQEAELAQYEVKIAELTANATQQRIEAARDLAARDAAIESQRAAAEAAKQRARSLEQAMRESNETCFSVELPADVLDGLRD